MLRTKKHAELPAERSIEMNEHELLISSERNQSFQTELGYYMIFVVLLALPHCPQFITSSSK